MTRVAQAQFPPPLPPAEDPEDAAVKRFDRWLRALMLLLTLLWIGAMTLPGLWIGGCILVAGAKSRKPAKQVMAPPPRNVEFLPVDGLAEHMQRSGNQPVLYNEPTPPDDSGLWLGMLFSIPMLVTVWTFESYIYAGAMMLLWMLRLNPEIVRPWLARKRGPSVIGLLDAPRGPH